MKGIYVKIHAEDRFRFSIYPRNLHNDPLATSVKSYISESACRQAMESFVQYVIGNNLCEEDGQRVKIFMKNDEYSFQFFDEQGKCLVTAAKTYYKKANCRGAIRRVYLSIKADV